MARRGDATKGSLNRAAKVMTALVQARSAGSTVLELAARTGLPRPTVYRTLDALMAIGWVQSTPSSKLFTTGPGFIGLSYGAIAQRPLATLAAVDLSLLARKVDQTLYLDVPDGLDVLCIGHYPTARRREAEHGHVGMRAPLGITAAGLAMLTALPESEAQAIIAANLPRYRDTAGFAEEGFRRCFERSRAAGHAQLDAVVLDRRMCGLGIAVRDGHGRAVAGIGLAFARATLNNAQRQRCVDLMTKAAGRLHQGLLLPSPTAPRAQ